jgi:hypothetical protein
MQDVRVDNGRINFCNTFIRSKILPLRFSSLQPNHYSSCPYPHYLDPRPLSKSPISKLPLETSVYGSCGYNRSIESPGPGVAAFLPLEPNVAVLDFVAAEFLGVVRRVLRKALLK